MCLPPAVLLSSDGETEAQEGKRVEGGPWTLDGHVGKLEDPVLVRRLCPLATPGSGD